MKKIATSILVICLVCSLLFAGCANTAEQADTQNTETTQAETPTATDNTVAETGATTDEDETPAAPKYVFYLIGDGLGASQRQITEYYLQHMTGDDTAKLTMNSMPYAGINTTFSLDTLVTDSAAAGTALSSGIKTNNGVIAQSAEGEDTTTLIEAAEVLGYATGVITSTRITHATPASFFAHNVNRDDENGIAADIVDSSVDFIAGGGLRHFLPAGDGSKREDDRDLVAEFEGLSYLTFTGDDGASEFASYTPAAGDQVLALLTSSHMPYEVDRANDADTSLPSLSELTETAVDLLSQDEDGFFLMVEGGRIDHACHPNDIVGTVYDTLEFDEVVDVAVSFCDVHPDETLIVVVGDHETGGMGLGFATDYFLNLDAIDGITASFEGGYGYGYEAGADRDAYFEYLESVGITGLTDEEKATIEAGMDLVDDGIVDEDNAYAYNEAGLAVNDVISERVGIQWTTFAHTGTQIPFSAMGVNAENFTGFMDNTDIALKLADILSIEIGL